MNSQGRFGEYEIFTGDHSVTDVPAILGSLGGLIPARIQPLSVPKDPREEEKGIALQNIQEASAHFERTRSQVRGALQAIVRHIFEKFQLSKSNGLDCGSGATGEMVEQLLPEDIERGSWTQSDINPAAVAENKRRHPNSRVVVGSYLDIGKIVPGTADFPLVTALSSFDATQFMAKAVEEVRKALAERGYFLHVQDVRPGFGVGIREMEYMGVQPNQRGYAMEAIPNPQHEPLLYVVGGEKISVGELFRRQLGRAISQDPSMELVFNEWVTARKALPRGEIGRVYYLNLLLNSSLPEEEASAVVTVARRRN